MDSFVVFDVLLFSFIHFYHLLFSVSVNKTMLEWVFYLLTNISEYLHELNSQWIQKYIGPKGIYV